MWIGNLVLLLLNLPLARWWVPALLRVLRVPRRALLAGLLVACGLGALALGPHGWGVWLVMGLGLLGFVLQRLGCEGVALLLGFVLAPGHRRAPAPHPAALARQLVRVHRAPGVGRAVDGGHRFAAGGGAAATAACRPLTWPGIAKDEAPGAAGSSRRPDNRGNARYLLLPHPRVPAPRRLAAGLGGLHRLQRQGHHRQARLPLRGGRGHADHVRMLFALPLFLALAWWSSRGKPPLTPQRLAGCGGPGLHRLLPGQLPGFLGPAIHQRQPGAADPVPQPHLVLVLGWVFTSAASPPCRRWRWR